MRLTRHAVPGGERWAVDGQWLDQDFRLSSALTERAGALVAYIEGARTGDAALGAIRAPIEAQQEIWACGVTYQRSRDARVAEAQVRDIYTAVYDAERPELFFKSPGWRVRGEDEAVRIRADSHWNVPESELALVVNAHGEIVGYTAGNDMSSRDIEGENPLYLPQAKSYDGSCSLGPAIELCEAADLAGIEIGLRVDRDGTPVFEGHTSTAAMKRTFPDLVRWLFAELSFPSGVVVLTGTGIVPPDEFTLRPADVVTVRVGNLDLRNPVSS